MPSISRSAGGSPPSPRGSSAVGLRPRAGGRCLPGGCAARAAGGWGPRRPPPPHPRCPGPRAGRGRARPRRARHPGHARRRRPRQPAGADRLVVDLHPGERVVFEGHPSWRALLSVYLGGTLAALAIAVVVVLAASTLVGVAVGAALVV